MQYHPWVVRQQCLRIPIATTFVLLLVLFFTAITRDLPAQQTSWTWTQTSTSGPIARLAPALIYDTQRSRIVLFGGYNLTYLGDTWEWNGLTWTQNNGVGPLARYFHSMAYDSQRRRTVLFGGLSSTSTLSATQSQRESAIGKSGTSLSYA
ncbi:MAG: hypothetical protein EXS02_09540 [Planctomycetes bacterium]|nr:hypothetical protein [Planctomycetota bacterium]